MLNGYTLPSNIKTINSYACTNQINRIVLNEGLETINASALIVIDINIPSTVTYLRPNSFSEVENISVSPDNTKYDSRNNCNCVIETVTNELVAVGLNYNIPSSVKSIGNAVFGYTYRFKSITIPDTVESINDMMAFAFCYNLESLVLPKNIKFGTRQDMYFSIEGCSSLKSFTIPSTVKYLNKTDLYSLSSLEYLSIPAITKIDADAFSNTPKLTKVKIDLTQAQWEALNYDDASDRLKNIEFEFKS